MSDLVTLLADQPLLLLFVVAALGYPVGRLRLGGTAFGVAAVLFVGLAFGALDPRLELPEFIYVFGLVLFVYSVGLTSGSGLIASFRRRTLREHMLVIVVLLGAAALTIALAATLSLDAGTAGGLFAGGLTNTPALAAVLEQLGGSAGDGAAEQPVIAYSLTYPVGVIGALGALALGRRVWRVDPLDEKRRLEAAGAITPEPVTQSVTVTRKADAPLRLETLRQDFDWQVVFGRVRRNGETQVVDPATTVQPGDVVTVVGPPGEIARVTSYLGRPSAERIEWDRTSLDYRRVFVSSPEVAGRRIADLELLTRFGAVVTRVRRGDVEMLANDELVLELGDRVRVVATHANLDAVTAYFGDSYRAVSEIDVLAFSAGSALGLLLGAIPFPLPGGVHVRLGIAGGPLVVALLLGYLGRTGPIVWVLPYSANLTLRQVGLVLFLAAIGTRAGWEFRTLLATGGGMAIIGAGAVVTCVTAMVTLWVGHRVMKMPFALASGLLSAVQTQPAVLGFAVEQSGNDLPNLTYARTYPLALVLKIVLAQLLVEVMH